jgi:hypothetical protein
MRSYSGFLDLDLPRLARGDLAQPYRQDAVVQGRPVVTAIVALF